MTDRDNLIYGDDLKPGLEFSLGSMTLSEADIIAFAQQWDPQPIHTNPTAASEGPWGGIIASGIQTVAVYQRLIVDALWSRAAVKAGRSFQVELRRPVRPGTTLAGKVLISEVTVRPERNDALVVVNAELVDESGAVVLKLTLDGFMLLRNTTDNPAAS